MTTSAPRYRNARRSPRRVAGLMSGTSADGVDVAIVDFSPRGKPSLLAFATYPYSSAVRRRVLDVSHAVNVSLDELVRLDFLLGELFADAVIALADESRIKLSSIDLIGSHGQTVRHLPETARFCGRDIRGTMQIAQASVIAQRTDVTTVSDFRPRDIAAGGSGAPLVPLTDWMLLGSKRQTRAVQNIGGIANVTLLSAGGGPDSIIAFDTGPGNMIIDHLVAAITGGRKRFDRGGRIGAKGSADQKTLTRLMTNAYFRRRPPKTTGRELFGRDFADKLLNRARAGGLSDADVVATATDFTAASIADAYRRHLPASPDEVILCGGGAKNPLLVTMLTGRLAGMKISTIDKFGIDSDAKEAISFAMLARLTVRGESGNAPSATGA
ncbi:MAG: anhydro-N-acetylmuramic acid kinase, partial [Phycisphaerae bacterium]|nr:anhydro-N-acetylmuramic acid kinase [Phycisphaerae bacterium]